MLQTIQHAISVRVRTGERVLLEGNPTLANVRAITKAGTVKKVCLLCSNSSRIVLSLDLRLFNL